MCTGKRESVSWRKEREAQAFAPRDACRNSPTSAGRERGLVPVVLWVVLTSVVSLVACVSPRSKVFQIPAPPEVVQSAARFRKEYVLAPGDQIEVAVRRVAEVSRNVVIRPDGYISLPILQDVPAAGLTARELSEKLTELFSARLVNPEVNVIPIVVRQPMVYVVGDVNAAAGVAVPFREAPTAIQAITLAGGFRRSAAASDVAIIRLTEDGYFQAILVGAMGGGQPGPFVALRSALLQPDDIVFVPENGRSQVARFLDDFVNRPLSSFNAVFGTYVNFRLIQRLSP